MKGEWLAEGANEKGKVEEQASWKVLVMSRGLGGGEGGRSDKG